MIYFTILIILLFLILCGLKIDIRRMNKQIKCMGLNMTEKRLIKDKNCYNCKYCETYDEGEGYGFVSLCEKDCMNTDGYFDYEYHRFKKPCICPFWEEDKND